METTKVNGALYRSILNRRGNRYTKTMETTKVNGSCNNNFSFFIEGRRNLSPNCLTPKLMGPGCRRTNNTPFDIYRALASSPIMGASSSLMGPGCRRTNNTQMMKKF